MISTNLLDNDSAAEGLPMRLVVTVILLSVIIGLSAKAATLFIDDANEKKLKGQLDLIDKRASVLYIQGGAQDICLLYTSPSPRRLRRISYAVFCLKKKK